MNKDSLGDRMKGYENFITLWRKKDAIVDSRITFLL